MKIERLKFLGPLSDETGYANFGDKRLSQRLGRVSDALCLNPSGSLPAVTGNASQLEGLYRLLRNHRVVPERTLEPHYEATCQRISQSEEPVLVIHDTTDFVQSGAVAREGMGWVKWSESKKTNGFFLHCALAVAKCSQGAIPLGVVGIHTWVRTSPPVGKAGKSKRETDPNRESLRWNRLVNKVHDRLENPLSVIHLSDCEADNYESFHSMIGCGQRFITRMRYDRVLAGGTKSNHQNAYEVLEQLSGIYEREVPLSKRHPSPYGTAANRKHPPRQSRVAKLTFSATPLNFKRPAERRYLDEPSLTVNVVHVREVDPPEGEGSVEWTLVTTEPIDTVEQVLHIVDCYRTRWQIEEYFKSLKTGCSFQKLQLESLTTLLNALAIYLPVAWRLFLLKSLSRLSEEAPAECVLTDSQISILRVKTTPVLPQQLSARKAMLAIAALGGHIKNNGEPGWQVLGRGYQKLLILEEGWLAATQKRCDLS